MFLRYINAEQGRGTMVGSFDVEEFKELLSTHKTQGNSRVSSIEFQGQTYWIKRREALNLRYRLQKGNADRAFEAERVALHQLNDVGAPVPAVVVDEDDFFVIADAGTNLFHTLMSADYADAERQAAFTAAGKTLAQFHNLNLAHGRPAIRDFCWKDGQITLIDLERYDPHKNTQRRRMLDLLIFIHSALSARQAPFDALQSAIDAYRETDSHQTWEDAQSFCRRMVWVNWLTKPIQWRGEGKAKEFKAIPLLFEVLKTH